MKNRPEEVFNTIAEKLRSQRISKEMTQEEFAELLGISQPQYSKLENGLKGSGSNSLPKLIHYANVLDIDINELFPSSENVSTNADNTYKKRKAEVYITSDDMNVLLHECDTMMTRNELKHSEHPMFDFLNIQLINEPFWSTVKYNSEDSSLLFRIFFRNEQDWKSEEIGTIKIRNTAKFLRGEMMDKKEGKTTIYIPLGEKIINDFSIYYRVINDYFFYRNYDALQTRKDEGIYLFSKDDKIQDIILKSKDLPDVLTIPDKNKDNEYMRPANDRKVSLRSTLFELKLLCEEGWKNKTGDFVSPDAVNRIYNLILRLSNDDRKAISAILSLLLLTNIDSFKDTNDDKKIPLCTVFLMLLKYEGTIKNIDEIVNKIHTKKLFEGLTEEHLNTMREDELFEGFADYICEATAENTDITLSTVEFSPFTDKITRPIEQIIELWVEYYNEMKKYYEGLKEASDLDIWEESYSNIISGNPKTYVIKNNGRNIGVIYLRKGDQDLKDDNNICISELFIINKNRRKGFATSAIDLLRQKFKGKKILISYSENNKISQKFWENYAKINNFKLIVEDNSCDYETTFRLETIS